MVEPINTPKRGTFWLPTLDDPPFQVHLVEQDPTGWRMVVGCILLLPQIRGSSRRQMLDELFGQWPDARRMSGILKSRDDEEKMLNIISSRSLRRVNQLIQFSGQWNDSKYDGWKNSTDLWRFIGCGWHASESWRIFIDRDYATEPQDYILHRWVKLMRDSDSV